MSSVVALGRYLNAIALLRKCENDGQSRRRDRRFGSVGAGRFVTMRPGDR